jgi:hypothetical protein
MDTTFLYIDARCSWGRVELVLIRFVIRSDQNWVELSVKFVYL